MADVKLPGIGPVDKKALIAASAIGGVVLVYAYVRRSRSGSAAPAAADGSQDPGALDTSQDFAPDDAGLGLDGAGVSSIDPATGFPSGSPQDLAALGLGGDGGGGTGTAAPPETVAEWENRAIMDLENAGVSQAVLTAARNGLPRYLAGLTLNADQASAVKLALGLAGEPPGGPYSIKRAPTPPPSTGHAAKPVREVATGAQSLNQVAKARNTSAAHIIAVTQGSAEISAQNRAKFDTYVAGGTSKKMPKGLVYYTSNK